MESATQVAASHLGSTPQLLPPLPAPPPDPWTGDRIVRFDRPIGAPAEPAPLPALERPSPCLPACERERFVGFDFFDVSGFPVAGLNVGAVRKPEGETLSYAGRDFAMAVAVAQRLPEPLARHQSSSSGDSSSSS